MKSLATASVILSTLLQPSEAAVTTPLRPAGSPDYPIHVETKEYQDADGALLEGFVSLPEHHRRHRLSRRLEGEHDHDHGTEMEKVPAVIILHDASGPDDYEKQRATILSHDHGYVGFAADIYGPDGPPPGADWMTARPYLAKFTGNATFFSQRIQAAVDYVQGMEEVDASKVAIVGYCMGGTGVVHYLNHGKVVDGGVPLAGAVSVHPSLADGPEPTADNNIPSLHLTGGADFLTGPEAMATLESNMKSGTADPSWETVRYSGIGHGFSNWFSEDGYDERTDARSWHSLMAFFKNEFGTSVYATETPPESRVTEVDYMGEDSSMKGYVAKPESVAEGEVLPVVIILPHKLNDAVPLLYEKQRATQMADDFGYLGFVADIYSSSMKDETAVAFEDAIYEDPSKLIKLVQASVDYVKGMEGADPTKIAVVGFGFGGSAALLYGMSDEADAGVKAVASFHGELDKVATATEALGIVPETDMDSSAMPSWPQESSEGDSTTNSTTWGETRRELEDSPNKPHILVQSGADGDDMADVMELEKLLVALEANYELTRFSNANGAWTVWDNSEYDAHATSRSFDQLQTVFVEVLGLGAVSSSEPTIEDPSTEGSSAGTFVVSKIVTVGATLMSMGALLL